MTANKDEVKKVFDDIADSYIALFGEKSDLSSFPTGAVRMRLIRDLIQSSGKTGGQVIDIGCGFGLIAGEIVRMGFDLVGVDSAENMIALASERLSADPELDNARFRFQPGDAENLDFPDDSFDVAIASGLVEYLATDDPVIAEIKRVLKPGGIALISFRNRLFNLFSLNEDSLADLTGPDGARLLAEAGAELRTGDADEALKAFVSRAPSPAPEAHQGASQRELETDIRARRSMTRRQHTPAEIRALAERHGLRVDAVNYFHFHPFPPVFEQSFPEAFNQLALDMEVFSGSPVGALMASGIVAVLVND